MKNQRNSVLLLLAIILSLCCVIVLAGAVIWNAVNRQAAQQVQPEPTAVVEIVEPEATRTTSPDDIGEPTATEVVASPDATRETTSSANLSEEILADMEKIQADVIDLRGLNPAGEFSREILTVEELSERVNNEFFAEYTPEEAVDDARVLALLGLLEPDFDLISLFKELYSEQVLGYYDDDTGEMVIVGSDEFKGPEKLTYAHEYAHALQDENFDFDEGLGFNDDACEEDSERCGAIRALIEGEATLIELQWFLNYATIRDQREIAAYYADLDFSGYDDYPAYLQKDFVFPYDQGYTFAETLFTLGGWQALNAAYANPPVTTEQIIHPEKYPDDTPVPVEFPDLSALLGDGWENLDDNVMGEWYTYLILSRGSQAGFRIDDVQAAEAAAGWGGDRYVVFINRETDDLVLAFKAVWDTPADKREFDSAFRSYGDARFGAAGSFGDGGRLWETDSGVHVFVETGDASIWIAAPTPDLAQQILEAIR